MLKCDHSLTQVFQAIWRKLPVCGVLFFVPFKYFLILLLLFFLLVKNVFKASSKLIRIFSKPHFSTRKLSTFCPHENRESARYISSADYSCKKIRSFKNTLIRVDEIRLNQGRVACIPNPNLKSQWY